MKAARAYLGAPFLHQGRDRRGIDCGGLAICCAKDCRLSDFDIDGYGRVPSGRRMQRILSEQCTEIPISEALTADLYHMAFEDEPQHIAIISRPGYIIHADNMRGVVEHILDDSWRYTIRGAYRLPGVT